MQTKLIKVKNYLLLVGKKFPEVGDWFYITVTDNIEQLIDTDYGEFHPRKMLWPKVMAHLPLNNSPVLEGVPLLPELPKQEEDVVQQGLQYQRDFYRNYGKGAEDTPCLHWITGYKANTKKWSDEHIWKAYNQGMFDAEHNMGFNHHYLQSLSPVPVGFDPLVEVEDRSAVVPTYKLKTTKATFRGKEVEKIQGRWIWEN